MVNFARSVSWRKGVSSSISGACRVAVSTVGGRAVGVEVAGVAFFDSCGCSLQG